MLDFISIFILYLIDFDKKDEENFEMEPFIHVNSVYFALRYKLSLSFSQKTALLPTPFVITHISFLKALLLLIF